MTSKQIAPRSRPPAPADLTIGGVLCIALIVVFAAIALAFGVTLQPGAIGAGVFGWLIALGLRAPVGLVAIQLGRTPEQAQPYVIAASGPAEELMRLIVLLLIGRSISDAVSIGLGWAGIEILYSIVNGIALGQLAARTDPEAERAKAMLPTQSMLTAGAIRLGVLERAWASLLHIGFTLIVAAAPILVILTAIVHSTVNLAFVRFLRHRPIADVELGGLVVGAVVFAVGLALSAGRPA